MKKDSTIEDSLLIKKAQDGNEGAFNFLMTKYYPRVYASLYSFTKSKEDSEDLAQQTFIKYGNKLLHLEEIISISAEPIEFISSLIIFSIFLRTRYPIGRKLYWPEDCCLIRPALSINLWLIISASEGLFFWVNSG